MYRHSGIHRLYAFAALVLVALHFESYFPAGLESVILPYQSIIELVCLIAVAVWSFQTLFSR